MFFLKSYGPHRVFCFKIDKSFYLFINYTLAGIAQDVAKTLSSLSPINELITWRDYIVDSFLIDYEPIVDRNLNAIFATSATTSCCTKHIQAFLNNQSNCLSILSVNIHFSDVTCLLRNSFLLLLSSISSPFFNTVLSLLSVLALAWGLILTVYTIANIIKNLKSTLTPLVASKLNRFQKEKNTNELSSSITNPNLDPLIDSSTTNMWNYKIAIIIFEYFTIFQKKKLSVLFCSVLLNL